MLLSLRLLSDGFPKVTGEADEGPRAAGWVVAGVIDSIVLVLKLPLVNGHIAIADIATGVQSDTAADG